MNEEGWSEADREGVKRMSEEEQGGVRWSAEERVRRREGARRSVAD